MSYTSAQIVQAVPVGSGPPGLICVKAETAFTTATSVTADNVFTTSHTNYQIRIRYSTSTTNGIFMKFRVSGVSTSTNYNFQDFHAAGSFVTTARTSSTSSGRVSLDTSGIICQAVVDISGPQLASATIYSSVNGSAQLAQTTTAIEIFGGNQSDSTQFDGVELLVATGTTTGSYTIYGYSKTV